MSKKITLKDFEKNVLGILKPVVESYKGEDFTALGKRMFDYTVNHKKLVVQTKTDAHSLYVNHVFSGYIEIWISFNTLKDIEMLVKSISNRLKKVDKTRVLTYHMNNYLNEIYILQLRLKNYPVTILRKSKRSKEQGKIKPIVDMVDKAFSALVSIRGSHVHTKRYSDEELNRLEMLRFMSEMKVDDRLDKTLKELYNIDFLIVRAKRLDNIRKSNMAIEKILDTYFSELYEFVFEEDGKLIAPLNLT